MIYHSPNKMRTRSSTARSVDALIRPNRWTSRSVETERRASHRTVQSTFVPPSGARIATCMGMSRIRLVIGTTLRSFAHRPSRRVASQASISAEYSCQACASLRSSANAALLRSKKTCRRCVSRACWRIASTELLVSCASSISTRCVAGLMAIEVCCDMGVS